MIFGTRPRCCPSFLARWRDRHGVVYAVHVRRSENWLKRLSFRFFYRLLTWMSRVGIPLGSGDFSLMSRRMVNVINAMPGSASRVWRRSACG